MRGPLLSGPLGSGATLRRLADRLRAGGPGAPIVVVRSTWLAIALAAELPVVGLVTAADHPAARKALRKPRPGGRLSFAVMADSMPLGTGRAAALVFEDLATAREGAGPALVRLLPLLRQGGLLVSADRIREPDLEADLAGVFLAAGLTHITQDRPREGALLTAGRAPHPAVAAALAPGGPG